jgi:hypothetical protein
MVPGSAQNWIAVNAVKQSNLNKKYENKDYLNHRVPTFRLRCSLRAGDHVDAGESQEQGTRILHGNQTPQRRCPSGWGV